MKNTQRKERKIRNKLTTFKINFKLWKHEGGKVTSILWVVIWEVIVSFVTIYL